MLSLLALLFAGCAGDDDGNGNSTNPDPFALGDVPQDEGTIALDYGMNYSFKALPLWLQGTGTDLDPNFVEDSNNYRGRRHENLGERAVRIPFE